MRLADEIKGFGEMISDWGNSLLEGVGYVKETLCKAVLDVPAAFKRSPAEATFLAAVAWAFNAAILIYGPALFNWKMPDPYSWAVLGTALAFALFTVGSLPEQNKDQPTTAITFAVSLMMPYIVIAAAVMWLFSKVMPVAVGLATIWGTWWMVSDWFK